jgi:type IV pilus assembly protein PilX
MNARIHLHRRSQRGITLVIVMVILVIVTILGIGGAQLALSGERSTRYDRDYLIASQAAEAALMDAQNDIGSRPAASGVRTGQFIAGNSIFFGTGACMSGVANSPNSQRGLCQPPADDTTVKPNWLTVNFNDTSATAPSAAIGDFTGLVFQTGTVGVVPAQAPRYIIEDIVDKSPGTAVGSGARIYRITAIGFGPNQQVQVVMQTAYRKP